ncbi:hypothetical protein GDO86_020314 [Hymenochirus boettgeri]|uniref:Uncharacterized protein n=1 Tax=Hymenochirus boettgeri TaxID=247094 RepID=A0A8T2IC52_9PIPI|nr:hypothetical protein GDO86_020314 [Hymenochirus boettgeri]
MKPTVRKSRTSKKVEQRTMGKIREKSKGHYSTFIYRLLKQKKLPESTPFSLLKDTMSKETCSSIAEEAARLSLYNKRKAITCQEIQSAMTHVRVAL